MVAPPELWQELLGLNAIVLHFIVEGLVVDPQEPCGSALVAFGHPQRPFDGLLLHLGRGLLGDLFQ